MWEDWDSNNKSSVSYLGSLAIFVYCLVLWNVGGFAFVREGTLNPSLNHNIIAIKGDGLSQGGWWMRAFFSRH